MNTEELSVKQPVRDISIITAEVKDLCIQARNMALIYVIEIGKRLKEAKAVLPHGQWGTWLSDEVGFSQRTAQNYMQLYEEYGDTQISFFGISANTQTIANLPYTKAIKLLALEPEDRAEFVESENVEQMSVKELEAAIKERNEARAEAEKAKERQLELEEKLETAEAAKKAAEARSEEAVALTKKVSELEAKAEAERMKVKEMKEKLKKTLENPKLSAKQLEDIKDETTKEVSDKIRASLRDEIEKAKKEAAVALEKAEAAKQAQQRAEASLSEARRQLKTASPDVAAFKELFVSFQDTINKMQEKIEKIRLDDTETADKLLSAMKAVITKAVGE